ncbi:dynein regulatory complex subunit 2 [Stegastes partitus]|uniref:Dynein regulatory complex subunit 2 n=1 Tax=Stegastes partitus TaxID=144197 RepID=A0A9Y4JKZ1_9TELE|nr:PREDICTED: coiled-coil domain-containing protein 65 [Stegastes partitus]
MPKKTKKGGGKTEEERLVHQQQRAQAEEEMAKKKEETLTLFLKDKLQKEERNTAVNQLKLSESWRMILCQTRAAELHRDAAVQQQTFERQMDELNIIIQRVAADLQEVERQSAHAQRSHLQQVEQLLAQQDRRLQRLQEQWDDCMQDLKSTLSAERKQMLSQCEQQQVKLQNLALSAEQRHRDSMREIHKLKKGDQRDSSLRGLTSFSFASSSVGQMTASEEYQKLKDANLQHTKALQQKTQELDELEQNLSKTRKGFSSQAEEENKLLEKEMACKAGCTLMERDLEANVSHQCYQLRNQLSRACMEARRRLTEFSVLDENAADELQAVTAKAEKVLLVAEMCCKLQSVSSSSSRPTEEHRNKEACEFLELQPLMQRLNAAVLQRQILKKHEEDLSRENEQLELLLLHLDDAIDGRRALLTVSQAPTTSIPAAADRRHNVIEAVHAVKHSL